MKRLFIVATAVGALAFSPFALADNGVTSDDMNTSSPTNTMTQDNMMQNNDMTQNKETLGEQLKQMSQNFVDVTLTTPDGKEVHVTMPKMQADILKKGDTLTVSNDMGGMNTMESADNNTNTNNM